MIKILIILVISSFFIEKIEQFKQINNFSVQQLIFFSIIAFPLIFTFIAIKIIKIKNKKRSIIEYEDTEDSNISAFGTIKKD